jgi:GrpB-like predicted nucleotidyltransferase (UPF0157 family)
LSDAFQIQVYQPQQAVFRGYDPRVVDVAALLAQAISKQNPRLVVDHIGSTAVPECSGKGIIDLAVTYSAGDLEQAKAGLEALGFQHQDGREPFPETRPMRVASITALETTYLVHAHVIERSAEEHRTLIGFRDALRRQPELRRAYEQDKQRILASGLTDSLDYCNAKTAFIESTLSAAAKP